MEYICFGSVTVMNLQRKLKARDEKGSPAAAVGIAVFVMFVISGVLLLLLAMLLYKMELSEAVVKIGIVVIYVVSGVAGGLIAGKMRGEQKFLWGLAAGIVYFAVLFLVSFAVQKGMPQEPVKILTTLVLCGASGMAGGMIG